MVIMNNNKILVSACLLGKNVRYDSEILTNRPLILEEWEKQGIIIPICPEVAGGLPVPRPPAEIQEGDGNDVVNGTTRVIDINGKDVTEAFITGAMEAKRLAEDNKVQYALLKARSPSCGSKMTYDGTFTGHLIEFQGVTAAVINRMGIRLFNEEEIDQLVNLIGDRK